MNTFSLVFSFFCRFDRRNATLLLHSELKFDNALIDFAYALYNIVLVLLSFHSTDIIRLLCCSFSCYDSLFALLCSALLVSFRSFRFLLIVLNNSLLQLHAYLIILM